VELVLSDGVEPALLDGVGLALLVGPELALLEGSAPKAAAFVLRGPSLAAWCARAARIRV
jgi:hypothetical protein